MQPAQIIAWRIRPYDVHWPGRHDRALLVLDNRSRTESRRPLRLLAAKRTGDEAHPTAASRSIDGLPMALARLLFDSAYPCPEHREFGPRDGRPRNRG